MDTLKFPAVSFPGVPGPLRGAGNFGKVDGVPEFPENRNFGNFGKAEPMTTQPLFALTKGKAMFIQSADGFISLDRIKFIRTTRDDRLIAVMDDGEHIKLYGTAERIPFEMCQFIKVDGFRHVWLDGPTSQPHYACVIGLYVSPDIDGGTAGVLLDDGFQNYLGIEDRSTSLLLAPSGVLSDGSCCTFPSLDKVLEYLTERAANRKQA